MTFSILHIQHVPHVNIHISTNLFPWRTAVQRRLIINTQPITTTTWNNVSTKKKTSSHCIVFRCCCRKLHSTYMCITLRRNFNQIHILKHNHTKANDGNMHEYNLLRLTLKYLANAQQQRFTNKDGRCWHWHWCKKSPIIVWMIVIVIKPFWDRDWTYKKLAKERLGFFCQTEAKS